VIGRLVGAYVGIFTVVLAAASVALYLFLGTQYHSLLLPALTTPEGASVYGQTMHKVAIEIGAADVPLLILVALASWALARLSLAPLLASQEREREFIADAAHELRSPLASIASVAQAARDERDGDRLREAFETIARTAMDASALVGDLLTLARAPQPGLLQREPVDLAAVARACSHEFVLRAREAGIELDMRLEPAIVDGDARRLRELLRNLLDNALKHASARISVATGIEDERAFVRVSDDGPGVEPNLRARLFERFVSGLHGGSGLGLAIAQWVARAHEGSLSLDERETGASFVALFPSLT
jgi:two-component system, OmpR family, sensor kinase